MRDGWSSWESTIGAHAKSSTRYVEVQCDRLELVGTFDDRTNAYTCATGDLVLPVAGVLQSTAPGTKLVGELHDYSDAYAWPADLRLGLGATPEYLDVRSSALRVLRRLAGATGVIGLLVLVAGYILVRRRRAAVRRTKR